MISRWAYEGLAVEKSVNNSYSSKTFEFELEKSQSKRKTENWLPQIKSRILTLQNPEENTKNELSEAKVVLIN